MADTSHHDPSDVLHYHAAGEPTKRRSTPIAATVIAIVLAIAAGFLAFKLKQQSQANADLQARVAQANSATDAVKADLASANTKLAGLQAQLDKANSGQTDLQAQMTKSAEQMTALQTQLDQAQASLKSEQEKAQTQVSELQGQLTLANDRSSALNKELAAAKSQITDLQAQLAKAKEPAAAPEPLVAKARPLPVTTEFKKGFFGGTFSLQVKNTGSEPLKVDIAVTGSDKTPSKSATIQGGGTFKVDGLAPGAKVVIASNGFESVTVTAQ